MSAAFEEICTSLGLAQRDDPLREFVAHEVIETARMGIIDAAGIRDHVLETFQGYEPKPDASEHR